MNYIDENNPAYFTGKNASCKLCDSDAINLDEYCEEHQKCYFCGDNDDCNCEEEMKLISWCCGAKIDTDRNLCYECKDNSQSAWSEHIENK
tara:strand:+ start:595 stop:867 length:273 start_codon:yes stop_codon:yes gene_type:complete